jgi:23S rRNA (cytosine1962-C5)-methyltransferase
MYPEISLKPDAHARVRHGCPWIYSNEIQMNPPTKAIAPGSLVSICGSRGESFGLGMFNAHSLIACRIVDSNPMAKFGRAELVARLQRCVALRERMYPGGCYRLVHSEGDALGGLVIDRYGGAVSIQINAAGMERVLPELIEAIDEVLAPSTIVLRNDSPVRTLEGLELYTRVERGDGRAVLTENGARFVVDLSDGQKTGWFYDQRENRAAVARLCRDVGRALDVYTYAGGFAVQMALGGAGEVVAVDRSESSLALARQSADENGLGERFAIRRGDAFVVMEQMAQAGERFDVVVVDPPAFAKNKADAGAAARGYRKMAKLAAPLVVPGGILFAASCSHHMERDRFEFEINAGVASAGRNGRILRTAGAGGDHPVHPQLPQTAYLKSILLQLD